MSTAFWILAAVVAGWIVQLYLSYRQSMQFMADVRKLRSVGKVSIGVGGKRYRGGRAYVAMAFDDDGVVRDALTLQGWTTFARSKPLPALLGRRANQIKGDREIPGLSRQQREAARQAAELLLQEGSRTTTKSPL